jgi:hypothetical protein
MVEMVMYKGKKHCLWTEIGNHTFIKASLGKGAMPRNSLGRLILAFKKRRSVFWGSR